MTWTLGGCPPLTNDFNSSLVKNCCIYGVSYVKEVLHLQIAALNVYVCVSKSHTSTYKRWCLLLV